MITRSHVPGRLLSARSATAAVAALAAVGLAACTSSGTTPTPSTSSSAPSSTVTSSTAAPGSLPSGVLQPSSLPVPPNSVELRKDVVVAKCSKTADGWQANGTVTNSRSTAHTYHIVVFFTTTQATVVSFARTKVSVGPGKTAKWSASSTFVAPNQMNCPLRAVS